MKRSQAKTANGSNRSTRKRRSKSNRISASVCDSGARSFRLAFGECYGFDGLLFGRSHFFGTAFAGSGHSVACLLPESQRAELWNALRDGARPEAARAQAGVDSTGAPVAIEGEESG